MRESKARDPLVVEPRGWIAQGALAVTPLGKGRAAKDAAGWDSQRAHALKRSVRRTSTLRHNCT